MPDTEMLNTLHKCAEIEAVLAEMYEYFASAFSEFPDVSQLFRKTAAEEKNHEYQIRLAIKIASSAISEIKVSGEDAEKHLWYAKEALNRVRKNIPHVEEALQLSLHCETIFSRFHMDMAARFRDESFSRLFSAMMAADDDHVASLEEALAQHRK